MNAKTLVAALDVLRKSVKSVAKQRKSKILPTDIERIKKTVLEEMGTAAEKIRNQEGFTIDPRAGGMVNLGEQRGYMMSPILNENAVQIPWKSDITADEILASVPESYYPRMQRGAYLGGWVDDGQVYIDPPERYLSKFMALDRGLNAKQLSGADLKIRYPDDFATQPSPFFDVDKQTRDELFRKRALQTLLLGGASSGAAGGLTAKLNYDE
jgi:hypothetical protein